MARKIPPSRFGRLIEVATQTFIRAGYQRTQMADIAEALGVAKGTLYGYVESKDALFDCAVRFADRLDEVPKPEALPVRTPKPGATVRYVARRLTEEAQDMVIVLVVGGELAIADPPEELRQILADLFLRLSRNRNALKLIDRCAAEYPDLAAAWFGGGRRTHHQLLVQLLRRRIADGSYRACEDVAIAARTVLETIAFWALHRHFDPAPQIVDDAAAERSVITFISRALLQKQEQREHP